MLPVAVLVTLVGLAAGVFDEELHNKYQTMPHAEFIEYFNKQDYSWKITKNENIKHLIPTQFNSKPNKFPLRSHDVEALKDLPENFDSREKWPHCESIKDIYYQDNCTVCWAFATATTASDRTCIHKNVHVRLSVQDLECSRVDAICHNLGEPVDAFKFWQESGLVTQDCKPYDAKKLLESNCVVTCVDGNRNYTQDKHFADKIYGIPNDDDKIKTELFINGPISADFWVYADFLHYDHGVYEHKYGDLVGGHSVRVIGYGVENGSDYWLVANSWGRGQGDNGYYKIKRFQKELEFEKVMISGLPKN